LKEVPTRHKWQKVPTKVPTVFFQDTVGISYQDYKPLQLNDLLKAVIGIEPMNKGFAVHLRLFAPFCTKTQSIANKPFRANGYYLMQALACRESPQKSPQCFQQERIHLL